MTADVSLLSCEHATFLFGIPHKFLGSVNNISNYSLFPGIKLNLEGILANIYPNMLILSTSDKSAT
jgi:hypothetical protein